MSNDEKNQQSNRKYGFRDIPLIELTELYKNDSFIPYCQYLRTEYWKLKRMEILERDCFRCMKCGGYQTKSFEDPPKLIWDPLAMSIWTDLDGNNRISVPVVPPGEPSKPYSIQIHHKKYVLNRLPWQYDNTDLVTLCNYCHEEVHKNHEIPVYNEQGILINGYGNCSRCSGKGYFPEYKHVQGGVCFKCGGSGFDVQLIDRKIEC